MNDAGAVIRILVVDDNPLWRDGVEAVVRGEADMTLVGEADSGEQAV